MEISAPRTSLSHPLQIAEIRLAPGMGKIGLTLCPGKHQSWGQTGAWKRDLGLDLDVVASWNAAVVVSLVEPNELERLNVRTLGPEVTDRHMECGERAMNAPPATLTVCQPCPSWRAVKIARKAPLPAVRNPLGSARNGTMVQALSCLCFAPEAGDLVRLLGAATSEHSPI